MPNFDRSRRATANPLQHRTGGIDSSGPLVDGLSDPLSTPAPSRQGVSVQMDQKSAHTKFNPKKSTTLQILGATKTGKHKGIDAGSASTAMFHGKSESVFAKTASKEEAKVELLSNKMMEQMNPMTPEMKAFPEKWDKKLRNDKKFVEQMGLRDDQDVLAMPLLNAVNLSDALVLEKDRKYQLLDINSKEENEAFDAKLKLSKQFQESGMRPDFIRSMGKIAIQDLMIHNSDRLLPFDKNTNPGELTGWGNMDNMMVETRKTKKGTSLVMDTGPIPIDNMNQLTESFQDKIVDPEQRHQLNEEVMGKVEDLPALAAAIVKGLSGGALGDIEERFAMSLEEFTSLLEQGLRQGVAEMVQKDEIAPGTIGANPDDKLAAGMIAMFNERLSMLKSMHGDET